MEADPDEPPTSRQRLDASSILREVMIEFKGFQASIEQKLDSAIVLSKDARKLAESSHQTALATKAQLDQLSEVTRINQQQIHQIMDVAQKALDESASVKRVTDEHWRAFQSGACVAKSIGFASLAMPNDKVDSATAFATAVSAMPRPSNVEQSSNQGLRRTIVVGGFPEDTRRNDIEDCLRRLVRDWGQRVEHLFTPFKRGRIGFIRFMCTDDMWVFMKNRSNLQKPTFGNSTLWIGVEKSKPERDAAKRTSCAVRVIRNLLNMSAEQLASPEYLEIDYRRSIIWVQQLRAFEWDMVLGRWRVRPTECNQLREAGILHASIDELMARLNQD